MFGRMGGKDGASGVANVIERRRSATTSEKLARFANPYSYRGSASGAAPSVAAPGSELWQRGMVEARIVNTREGLNGLVESRATVVLVPDSLVAQW